MFRKILIANRGEIACRIIRTAHRLGIQCVAVYSEADAEALHVKMADEAFCIGAAPVSESYLCGDAILEVAHKSHAEAIHPGYGFLSENAQFAEDCVKQKIVFIGPSAAAIRAMGLKNAAKKIMETARVPLVPGYLGDSQDPKILQQKADEVGYPLLLKAAAGGGGKGMRLVTKASEFASALDATKREAKSSFGDDQILIEKYITNPRHVEIQVFADQHGNGVYLFERDCSIQRRHQKIIEEAPAPGITEKLRNQMGTAAIAAAKAIDYVGAGTIEFLLDENNDFYFMEMNTRLQVEHPVTEMITGQDLVEWQLLVANGEKLPLKQKQLKINGHAFEARIYAEDAGNNFLPATGTIHYLQTPTLDEHVRIDSGITQGDKISHYYDPMIAKLIVWDADRGAALQRLAHALGHYQIVGVTTNLDLLANIAQHPAFVKSKINTGFIEQHQNELLQLPHPPKEIFLIASLYVITQQRINNHQLAKKNQEPNSPWYITDSWQLNLLPQQKLQFRIYDTVKTIIALHQNNEYQLTLDDKTFSGKVIEYNADYWLVTINNAEVKATIYSENNFLYILAKNQRWSVFYEDFSRHEHHTTEGKAQLMAPMPGKIIALLAKVGQPIEAGASLAIIEAMKMEHTIHAPANGTVKEWYFNIGDLVEEGVELLAFEET